jgi:RNA polymerase sigma-70 factor (ECF subfamily)
VLSHPQHDPDEALVLRALRGDRAGFDALVARYRVGALVIARRVLGASAEAEDVVQDAFVSAFLALPRLREPERFAFWLQVIVRNLALRRREVMSRSRSQVLDADLAASPESGPEAVAERSAEAGIVHRAIASLPEDYALPMALRYLHEMRLRDIANLLGLPLSLVKWRLHTGRQLLRDRLAGELMKGEEADVGD